MGAYCTCGNFVAGKCTIKDCACECGVPHTLRIKAVDAATVALDRIDKLRAAGYGVLVFCHPVGNDAPAGAEYVGQLCAHGIQYEARGYSFENVIDKLYKFATMKRN